jgi:hypothetical protein
MSWPHGNLSLTLACRSMLFSGRSGGRVGWGTVAGFHRVFEVDAF